MQSMFWLSLEWNYFLKYCTENLESRRDKELIVSDLSQVFGFQQTKNFRSIVSVQELLFQKAVIGSNLESNFSAHSELRK